MSSIVMGLFESRGEALDAFHRLQTEGVPESRVTMRVLREVAGVPAAVEPELAALAADPLVWGDARGSFVEDMHHFETAVYVLARSEADAAFACDVLKLYAPIDLRVRDIETASQIAAPNHLSRASRA
ncbi:MAG TPA: hypothetical protein VFA12_15685 [Stellaceae bacterium]|nr:hypothetical protein [Stellaceae bacterium]